MIEIAELLLIGVLAGILSSFFGVGGGIVMIPLINLFLPEIPQKYVIATSLSVILFNAGFNVWNFRRHVKPDAAIVIPVSLSVITFSVLATFVVASLSDTTLKLIFISTILTVALGMAGRSPSPPVDSRPVSYRTLKSVMIGLISGFVSGVTGLGGGGINVPLLYRLLHVDFKSLSAYSNAIMLFTGLATTTSFLLKPSDFDGYTTIGYIIPMLTAVMLVGSFAGSKIGVSLHRRVSAKILKLSFVILVGLIILRTLLTIEF